MSQDNGERRNLSVFTYSFIFICVVLVTILFVKEINVSSDFEDILYQKSLQDTVEQENKYYINKIKDEYGINIIYGNDEKNFINSINAQPQYDINIANNNIKIIYESLKKYPYNIFKMYKDKKYSLYIILVDRFNDNNIAFASKNTLNQYRIYLSNNEDFERSFHHEFFHVLEYYMADQTDYLYYSWNSYNPYGFNYEPNINKLTDEFVYDKHLSDSENSNSYFLSKYSKVSDKEDRAEIFAELMTLDKKESYLENGSRIKEKIKYLMSEIYENITVYDFYFSPYLE